MESEEKEAATGRSRNVVHILPQSMDSVPRFLTGPLERVDPSAGGIQLVVVTEDPESAVALAEAVLGLTGMAGIELFPVTSARRAARLMQGRPVLAIAGDPVDLAELIRGSHLKMQGVRTILLAWADDLMEGNPEATAALELVMTEVPKDAARVLVTTHASARVDAFVERYLRRARRVDEREVPESAEPLSLRYVTATASSRLAALRRLLDDLDPPSAAVVVGSGEADAAVSSLLRALGYGSDGQVHISRGEIAVHTHAVIFYGMPASRQLLAAAAAANPVALVAIVQPREAKQLRQMAGGEVKPLTLSDAGTSARDRERSLRRELSGVLDSGLPAREILALEPLLDGYDGIEIAAAALRLLERERGIRKGVEAAAAASAPRPTPPKFAGFERSGGSRGQTDRGSRGAQSERGGRGSPPPRSRDDRPPRESQRGGGRDAPRGAPRGTLDRGARSAARPRPDRGGRPPRDRS